MDFRFYRVRVAYYGIRPRNEAFDPRRRLLITDGHSSHLTAKFIAFCLEKAIDLVVLPPHSSYITQPLDVAIFSPLKTYLSRETDRLSRFDLGRISKVEWTKAYITAREEAFLPRNILSSFPKDRYLPSFADRGPLYARNADTPTPRLSPAILRRLNAIYRLSKRRF